MKNLNQDFDLVRRLRRLEKSQARYRAAFLITAALAAVLCTTGARRQAETLVQAKSFEVVNDDSKVLAKFSSISGKGDFRTYRADGSPLVSVSSSSDDSGRIDLYNADGKSTVTLSTSTTGAGSLVINNGSGLRAVQIGSTTAKDGGIWIYNAEGNRIATI